MKEYGDYVMTAACVLAGGLVFGCVSAQAIDAFRAPVTRIEQIRAEASEMRRQAQGASPAELRRLDRRAAELLKEVRVKYPQLVPKSAVRRGRVVGVRQTPSILLEKQRVIHERKARSPLQLHGRGLK